MNVPSVPKFPCPHPPSPVILSEARVSRSEAPAESKDPTHQ